jgi:hypothetical protein
MLPAESAEESKAVNGDCSASPATFEAVEQKLKDSKAHRKYPPPLPRVYNTVDPFAAVEVKAQIQKGTTPTQLRWLLCGCELETQK